MAASLLKALKDPALAGQLAGDSTAEELQKSLKDNKKELQQLQRSLKNAVAEFWIGAEDMLMRKATMAVDVDTTGQTSDNAEGVDSVQRHRRPHHGRLRRERHRHAAHRCTSL
jgi:ubiquinone biosynthesis protein UbiJ